MILGTYLRDKRNNVEGILYGNDGENAIIMSPEHLGKESCGVVKINWDDLEPTGKIAPMGAIPSKWYAMKEVVCYGK